MFALQQRSNGTVAIPGKIRRGYVIAAYIIHECATWYAYKIKLSVTHFEEPKSVVVNMRLLM